MSFRIIHILILAVLVDLPGSFWGVDEVAIIITIISLEIFGVVMMGGWERDEPVLHDLRKQE